MLVQLRNNDSETGNGTDTLYSTQNKRYLFSPELCSPCGIGYAVLSKVENVVIQVGDVQSTALGSSSGMLVGSWCSELGHGNIANGCPNGTR